MECVMSALVIASKQEYHSAKGVDYTAYDCAANVVKLRKKGTLSFMNFTFHLVALVVLIAAVCGLYLYRRWLENHDDHYIHLHNDAHDTSIINTQASMAKRLDLVDKLKNAGLVAVILYALAIAAMAVYVGWTTNPQS
jgi:uncharacterized protein (UPF0333 family)